MFFFLSKLLVIFLYPLTWVVILLLWSIFSKDQRRRKRLLISTFIVLFLFSNPFIFNKLVLAWQPAPVQIPLSKVYSAGIVLGGYESYDKNGKGYFNDAADRFLQVYKHYKQNTIKKIVVSGARVVDSDAVPSEFVRDQLLILGVPREDIIMEDMSKNTFENATNSRRKLDSVQMQPPYLLITSAMHMPRAVRAFKKAGVDIVPFPCDYHQVSKKFTAADYLLPKAEVLYQWSLFLKEIAGTLAYTVFNRA